MMILWSSKHTFLTPTSYYFYHTFLMLVVSSHTLTLKHLPLGGGGGGAQMAIIMCIGKKFIKMFVKLVTLFLHMEGVASEKVTSVMVGKLSLLTR